jgi:hypothetical protein
LDRRRKKNDSRLEKNLNEELRDLYPSPSIIRIMKSRMLKRRGHVARMGEKLGTTLAVTNNRSVLQLTVTVNVVPSSPIPVTLMMKVIRSSETSVLSRAPQCNIPEGAFLIITAVKTSNPK